MQHKREKKTTLSSKREHNMSDKRIYMQLEESNTQQKEKDSFIKNEFKEQIKEQPLEFALDELTKDIEINIVDGMAQINMPEPLLQIVLTLFKKLEQQIDKGISR